MGVHRRTVVALEWPTVTRSPPLTSFSRQLVQHGFTVSAHRRLQWRPAWPPSLRRRPVRSRG